MAELEFPGEFGAIPQRMRESLERFFLHGVRPGGFLTAVLGNDLFKAVRTADPENLPLIPLYVKWLRNMAVWSREKGWRLADGDGLEWHHESDYEKREVLRGT